MLLSMGLIIVGIIILIVSIILIFPIGQIFIAKKTLPFGAILVLIGAILNLLNIG